MGEVRERKLRDWKKIHDIKDKVCYACFGRDKINQNVFVVEELVNVMPSREGKPKQMRVKPMFLCKEHFIDTITGAIKDELFEKDNVFVAFCISLGSDERYKVLRKYRRLMNAKRI